MLYPSAEAFDYVNMTINRSKLIIHVYTEVKHYLVFCHFGQKWIPISHHMTAKQIILYTPINKSKINTLLEYDDSC
jgi:hypothetical protein